MKRPAFWLLLGLLSIAAGLVGYHYFPQAFSIVSLDITMDRDHALEQARGIMTRDWLGPPGLSTGRLVCPGRGDADLRRAGRRGQRGVHADDARRPLRRLHLAGPPLRRGTRNETTIRFTPDGRPYGFAERLDENAPGAALPAAAARAIGEAAARASWQVDVAQLRARRAGPGAAAGRPRRPHLHVRAAVADARTKGATGCSWSSRAIG